MKAAVYVKEAQEHSPLWWGFMSNTLPPGVNQMYATRSVPTGSGGQRAAFFLSSRARNWKKTVGEAIARASFPGRVFDEECCALFHLFVFSNYDTDNRLKLMNDTLEGPYVTDDKKIFRSAQFKTVVRKKSDVGFMYCLAPKESFSRLLYSFSQFADMVEGENGILRSSYSKGVHDAIFEFFSGELHMEERMSCGIERGEIQVA